ncbi:LysR substrate-binding domain-containing protein [Sneathiella marina]|uniref:LysR substrate-binding domain-containing protein n=1 Tax=Sneathiella marina TaxID=2950108 RepID=A0ABY4W4G1_9PROT|nr:LysR family transcriptional regulator [Sneathiella marina]USG59546.1 LysR substrate-binding domain-containing protein [Sneathiella marina]
MPSLDCLVFFEAASRHLNFTQAASELFVTQAAVSKRVGQLESRLGVALFHRLGPNLSLTAEGERLQGNATLALDYLDMTFQSISGEAVSAVSISANSAVSMFWLQPRMKIFGLSDEACAVNLITTDRTNDQLSTESDLAIIYSDENVPGWHCTPILEERLVPVVAPSLLERLKLVPQISLLGFGSCEKPTLLNYPRIGPESNNWDTWTEQLDLEETATWPKKEYATYAQTIGRALNGEGVALASVSLIERELRSGQLCCLSQDSLLSRFSYCLAYPRARAMRKNTRLVFEFVIGQARRQKRDDNVQASSL